jgi:excisionase family DNA binding protein
MKEDTIPMLFPYDPGKFWLELRRVVREEVAALHNKRANLYETAGLTYKPLYSIVEIAALFQISRPTIYEWTRHGTLKPHKIRGRVYYLHADIQQLLKQHADR